jgi:inosine/xanthosine triphosphate pyrophosphatase family protein
LNTNESSNYSGIAETENTLEKSGNGGFGYDYFKPLGYRDICKLSLEIKKMTSAGKQLTAHYLQNKINIQKRITF